jgi:hypothetical protein
VVSRPPHTALDQAIARGLAFVAEAQAASGEIPARLSVGELPDPAAPHDLSPFPTALTLLALAGVEGPVARAVRVRGAGFLVRCRERWGVWRFWPPGHPRHREIPADLDDTACASLALVTAGRRPPGNRRLVAGNVDAAGRFFTWLLPRPGVRGGLAWRLAARRERRFLDPCHPFWETTEAAVDDVDAVVNAHVVAYLGEGRATRGTVAWLSALAVAADPGAADRWYRVPEMLVLALARAAHQGVPSLLEPARRLAHRLLEGPDRSPGRNPSHFGGRGAGPQGDAQLAIALVLVDPRNPGLPRLIEGLLAAQAADGSWPLAALWYGGPQRARNWSSRGVSAAWAVEALARWRRGLAY